MIDALLVWMIEPLTQAARVKTGLAAESRTSAGVPKLGTSTASVPKPSPLIFIAPPIKPFVQQEVVSPKANNVPAFPLALESAAVEEPMASSNFQLPARLLTILAAGRLATWRGALELRVMP